MSHSIYNLILDNLEQGQHHFRIISTHAEAELGYDRYHGVCKIYYDRTERVLATHAHTFRRAARVLTDALEYFVAEKVPTINGRKHINLLGAQEHEDLYGKQARETIQKGHL